MAGKHRDGERSRLSLLAVQSIVCGVILLLVLIFRLIGGDTWRSLCTMVERWMTDDGLVHIATEQRDAEGGEGGRDIPLGEAVKSTALPDGVSPSPLTVSETAVVPLASGRVTSVFGYRTDPIRGGKGFHTGIDVAASAGEALYALYDGDVIAAQWDNSYGYYITVRTADGVEIGYAHCSTLLYKVGDRVQAGACIARVGSTGDSTGDHVHITAVRDGVFYDPALWIPEAWYA